MKMALFGFGKKKEEAKEKITKEAGFCVKVLGGGCAKCNELEAATVAALVIDDQVVSMGKVLKKNEVIAIIEKIRESL